MQKHNAVSWVFSTLSFPGPGVAAFIGFAAEAKPVRFKSAGVSTLHILPIGFNAGGATGTQGIGVLSTGVC